MGRPVGERTPDAVLPAVETSDGAGVRIRRSIGSSASTRVDPFLMLDEFGSDQPGDYIAGFPAHPHRGFETVTYMLNGEMEHRDHLGNVGLLTGGGQGVDLGMPFPGAHMKAGGDHLVSDGVDQHAPDPWIGMGGVVTLARQFQRASHEVRVEDGLLGGAGHSFTGSRARRSISSRNSLRS